MDQKPHLTFRFQNTLFAVAAAEVRGVLAVPELTVVPGQPAYISGVFNLRGVTVPVLNLSEQLGRCPTGVQPADCVMLLNGSRGPLGILANEVLDVKLISAADLVPVHAAADSIALRLATRMAKLGAQIAWLLQYGELWPLLAEHQLAAAAPLGLAPTKGLNTAAVQQQRTAALLRQAGAVISAKPLAFAVVTIEHAYYGLDLDLVHELCEPANIAPVPCCPPYIVGNINLRGEILTVLDIRSALRLPAAASDGAPSGSVVVAKLPELTAGLLVDAVIAVLYVDPQHCHPAPAGKLAGSAFVCSTTDFDGHVLNILNLPALLLHGSIAGDDTARPVPNAAAALPGSGSTAAGAPAASIIRIRNDAAQAFKLLPSSCGPVGTRARVGMLLRQVEELVGFWEEKMRDPADGLDLKHTFHQLPVQRLEQLDGTLARLRSCAADNNANLDAVARDLAEHIRTLGMQPLSALTVLVVRVGNHSYAIPRTALETTRLVTDNDVRIVNGQETVRVGQQAVAVVMLERLLELRQPLPTEQVRGSAVAWPCVIIKSGAERLGLLVDSVVDEQAVTVKPHGLILKRVRTVAGSAILGNGEVCIVLHAPDLFAGALAQARAVSRAGGGPAVATDNN